MKPNTTMTAYVRVTTADSEAGMILTNTTVSISDHTITYVFNRQNDVIEALISTTPKFSGIKEGYSKKRYQDHLSSPKQYLYVDILMKNLM